MNVTVPVFDNTRILVAGDIMFDRYWYGDTTRVSPEAPVPVVHVGKSEERPGGAANVALNLAVLGVQTRLVGLTGYDEAAEQLESRLTGAGVECVFNKLRDTTTIAKLRVISRHQQLLRLDFEDGFSVTDAGRLMGDYRDGLEACDAVVLSDYGKGTLLKSRELIASARRSGKPVYVDPKAADFSCYHGASVITPNMEEFERVAGPCDNEAMLVKKGAALLEELDIETMLVTRGEQGMTLLQRGIREQHFPARAREVFDVTGAGDTVIALLAAAHTAGQDLVSAAALANLAAGMVVGKLGTACVSVPELKHHAMHADAPGPGDVTAGQIVQLVENARSRGERIVMTNGCFDILHAGHVACLQEAKRRGDRLIVAVNDDASVQRIKGKGRPVNSLERRMAVLAALECVDWVVPFAEDTPERLICDLHPDLLVKGGDYRPEDIAGYDCVRSSGGDVVVLDYETGCSTSDIIEFIRQHNRA